MGKVMLCHLSSNGTCGERKSNHGEAVYIDK